MLWSSANPYERDAREVNQLSMVEASRPRIAIVGTGAIGSLLGACLRREAYDVTLVARPAHVVAIEKNGLTVDGCIEAFTVRPKVASQLDFRPDVVFIAVKSQDLSRVCRDIAPLVRHATIVLMQNGVRSQAIAGFILGEENLVSCILLLNARLRAPGAVAYVNKAPIIVGQESAGSESTSRSVQALLEHVADTSTCRNVRGAQWSKLLINAMSNSLDGMTGMPLGAYIKHAGLRRIGIMVLKEALAIVDAAGIKLEPLPGIPLSFFRFVTRMPAPVASMIIKHAFRSKGGTDIISSTLQSLERGRKTEIDYLNAEFVELAQHLGMPAPRNAKVVELIHSIEQTRVFFSPAELASHFA